VGDFNGDGKPDLVLSHWSDANVSLMLGNGAGAFGAPTAFPVGPNPWALATGDFNGDGKLDLAVRFDPARQRCGRLRRTRRHCIGRPAESHGGRGG
jgi:hypothetical protein